MGLCPIFSNYNSFDHFQYNNAGVEHSLSQLANIPVPDRRQFGMGNTKSTEKYASHQPICGGLRRIPSNHTIFVLYEFNGRRATIICRYQRHQFGADWIHTLHNVSMSTASIENIVHRHLLANTTPNEI